ncbi:protein mono-ADP-ribosyltransferase PARP11-like [Hydractinia symbiolongicarpus]|uniref:protein mono-ADP-ribosyltransferase PARP11-like n=1 Tax=Hydractinia symbiolongicarpus TaxID=13093 RepID=UPI00254E4749|nr:protein mono-ADP-ribosyltransferase PARP11-like [Hydractinia symbiolongicarpus]
MSWIQDEVEIATIKTLFPHLSIGEIVKLFSSFPNNQERLSLITNYLLDCQGNTGTNATTQGDEINSLSAIFNTLTTSSTATAGSSVHNTGFGGNAACAPNTIERLHDNTTNFKTNVTTDRATVPCVSLGKNIATNSKGDDVCVDNSNFATQILNGQNSQRQSPLTHCPDSGKGRSYYGLECSESGEGRSRYGLECSAVLQDDLCVITGQERAFASPQRSANKQYPLYSSNITLTDMCVDDYDFKWYWKELSDDTVTRFEKWLEEELEQIYRLHNDNLKPVKMMLRGDRIDSFQVNFSTMRLLGKKTQWHLKRVKVNKQKKNPTEEKENFDTPYASTWVEQCEDRELLTVPFGGQEWLEVCLLFNGTLDNMKNAITVTKIERVQNKWLWRKYCLQKKLMIEKNGKNNVNEKLLFHGTRKNKPVLIWKGENSFDLRHCHVGNWGKGAYFAEKAAYSINYAYESGSGEDQIFMANVLTGFNIQMKGDKSLQLPPVKETDSNGIIVRYDSVSGLSWGYKIYVLYQLDVAYPSYLITYKKN